jgi:hypothetical protein
MINCSSGLSVSHKAFLWLVAAVWIGPGDRPPPDQEKLTLTEARSFLVELINRDRAALGLKPVVLDSIATATGQKHADEMATQRYLSHRNRDGKLPDQRYTEAGGLDAVQENVFLDYRWIVHEPADALDLDNAPRFTRHEIEDLEAAYFNQRPPYNSHRTNIVDPSHTHVGIGLTKARRENATAFANAMEFVNKRIEVNPIPREARVGDTVIVSGKLPRDCTLRSITIGRDDAPPAMSVEDLKKTRQYKVPPAIFTYRKESFDSPRPISVSGDGSFRLEVTLSDERRPGVYYISIIISDPDDRAVVASRRTIVVK